MSDTGSNSSHSAEALLSDELLELCWSDSLSEEGLREIFDRHQHFLSSDSKNRRLGDYEFFLEACCNERVTEGIIRYLLEYFPAAASAADDKGQLPLHVACLNENVTVAIVQLLIDAAPDSVRSVNKCTFRHPASVHNESFIIEGWMPLHYLCDNENVDEISALEIVKLLLEKHPEAVRHVDNAGNLPLHIALVCTSDPHFCRVLIEAYPGSERMSNMDGELPLHLACWRKSLPTAEYLYKLYPDAINHATPAHGSYPYPIHYAISDCATSKNLIDTVDTVNFLLDSDPNVKLQRLNGLSLLQLACQVEYHDSNIEVGIQVIKAIYDAHPEAIESNNIASNIHRFHQQIQTFINGELAYASQAEDLRQMTTPDEMGQLPLHTVLQNNVTLGSIKLLLKGNPPALQTRDNSGTLPLHVACEHHDSPSVVEYLVELDTTTLGIVDREGNTVLHLACRGAKYETIAMLLDKYDAVSVSKRNAHKKLPLDLLWESSEVQDRESIEYMESVFRLLKAFPELLMNTGTGKPMQLSASAACPGPGQTVVKKRKLGNE